MRLNFITTKLQASVEGKQEEFIKNYQSLPDDTKVWCMIDLVNSSNYRLLKGPAQGYLRGETFFTLIKNVISQSNQIRIIKEMGDAVLLASDSLRPLLESVILICVITDNLKKSAPEELYPFAIRCGFSYGVTKRLVRPNEDFLGPAIDQLARIMSIKSEASNILIQEEAFQHFKTVLAEYQPAVEISDIKQVPIKTSKGMIKDIYYREAKVDLSALMNMQDYFVDWRK